MANKLKVLLLGSPTQESYEAIGFIQTVYGGGWVKNLVNGLRLEKVNLYSLFVTSLVNDVTSNVVNGVNYIAVPDYSKSKSDNEKRFETIFKKLIRDIQPDLVHIIGTEREYNYAMFKAFDNPNRVIISLTGLITFCAQHYLGHIDRKELRKRTIGDILRRWGPLQEQKEFLDGSVFEQKLLKEAKYVFGRTSWDKECSLSINPSLQYVHCGEIVNPVFYGKKWKIDSCERHTIFVSQASYPLKGFHILLDALPSILSKYPDTRVIVAGYDMFDSSSFIAKIKRTTYANYLLKKIKKLGIDKNCVQFTGCLESKQMLEQYLRANVFVLPSAIENSSNSLGEAMLVGTPCVAANVGGVPDMLEHGANGLLYPSNEPNKLAEHVLNIFENDVLANDLSSKAKIKATKMFNKEDIIKTTIDTYNRIIK